MFKKILITLFSLLIISCASVQTKDDKKSFQKYWPKLPEMPRYKYMMTIYSSDDVVKKSDAQRMRESLVGRSQPQYVFKRPIDITVQNGMMYFLDSDKPMVNAFDFRRRTYFGFGYRREGKLSNPVSVAVDKKGFVYVADRGRKSVLVFDSFGLYSSTINMAAISAQISGLAIDDENGYLYVTDRGGIDTNLHQLFQYSLQGELIRKIGTRGSKPLEFNLPLDVTVGSDGSVYVLDAGNFRVQKFDSEGNFVLSWGNVGDMLGQFGSPRSIAIDDEDNVYVSDAQFGNVQVFNAEGKLLMALGGLSQDDFPGAFSLITGVTVDDKSHLYILDQFLKKLEVYKIMDEKERSLVVENAKKLKQ